LIRRIWLHLIVCFLALSQFVSAQEKRTVKAVRFPNPPVIDGSPDEEVWQLAQPFGDFFQFTPQYGKPSPLRTEVRIGYDDEAVYFAFTCYDPAPQDISAIYTKRDSPLSRDDGVVIMLDTFNDKRSCTGFGTNLLGTQLDFRVTDNGRSIDNTWDANWLSAGAKFEEGWTAEFAIPFRILKFQRGEDVTWGLNVGRAYPRTLEESYWVGGLEHPMRASQFGELTGLDLRGRLKRYEIIPYALAQLREGKDPIGKAGIDLRYRMTSNLGVDLTINPDFAMVEADVEQINLTRFELRIPEKRPFFLEGGEMFSQRITQFYSRRIGDIPWGAKLSGKVSDWDLAVIGAQSEPFVNGESDQRAAYSVIRAKKGLFGPSNIGFLAVNRRYFGENQGSVGIDATLFFTETLGMTAQLVRAHGPENDGALSWFIRPAYDSANSHFHVRYSNWDEGLMANMNAVGFISDDNRKEFDTNLTHTFWFNRGGVENVDAEINYNRYYSRQGVLRSWELDAECSATFSNKWSIGINQVDEFKRYEKDFRNRSTNFEIGFDNRAGRSFDIEYGFGTNYDSDLKLLEASVQMKITDSWDAGYGLTKLWLDPDPEGENTWIHVLRSDYYFTKDLYLKLFYQTNSAIEKRNVQTLLVWRFLPPFGSLQVAYQYGSSRFGVAADLGHTLFTKLAWVF
jgi:hypothetical protein